MSKKIRSLNVKTNEYLKLKGKIKFSPICICPEAEFGEHFCPTVEGKFKINKKLEEKRNGTLPWNRKAEINPIVDPKTGQIMDKSKFSFFNTDLFLPPLPRARPLDLGYLQWL